MSFGFKFTSQTFRYIPFIHLIIIQTYSDKKTDVFIRLFIIVSLKSEKKTTAYYTFPVNKSKPETTACLLSLSGVWFVKCVSITYFYLRQTHLCDVMLMEFLWRP